MNTADGCCRCTVADTSADDEDVIDICVSYLVCAATCAIISASLFAFFGGCCSFPLALQWSTAKCPTDHLTCPTSQTSACPKKVSHHLRATICGQGISFKCPTSESGLDQPSQKKCPRGVGHFAVLHCRL
jgi:hypothetical protein